MGDFGRLQKDHLLEQQAEVSRRKERVERVQRSSQMLLAVAQHISRELASSHISPTHTVVRAQNRETRHGLLKRIKQVEEQELLCRGWVVADKSWRMETGGGDGWNDRRTTTEWRCGLFLSPGASLQKFTAVTASYSSSGATFSVPADTIRLSGSQDLSPVRHVYDLPKDSYHQGTIDEQQIEEWQQKIARFATAYNISLTDF